ncbi:DUF1801 domain-containing protein [Brumimicrobium glaciale]|uniref:DUF1801 domain-containing protein n=1 Tax=Brumimicrobium glaciale TaxID=200475 RepID=A0A4Q4KLI4_9FLAO|nr:DUF1801 domain-containing protein [Brumimicrobium glaciale]RYM34145.1 DUF1801 domain-containing protein [Brumimicrobium glaciale]
MSQEPHNYYLKKEEPNKSCLLVLRDIILEQDENISESLKWNSPCFSYKNKMFCFLMIDKKLKEPYILMVEGARIDFPELDQGTRTRMKVLNIDPNTDLPIDLIENILQSALDLYRNGVIKTKN